ncbi:type II toxin-antitoxin system RelE/ParE family toxin [Nocardia sp. NPDC003345]
MSFRLEMVDEMREWLHRLRHDDRATAILVGQAITALLDEGPALGRPLVDRIQGSPLLHNLKELRPGSAGTSEIRILFVFDPERNAVLLVAGDKSGSWTRWYREAIPVAESRYAEYLENRKRR